MDDGATAKLGRVFVDNARKLYRDLTAELGAALERLRAQELIEGAGKLGEALKAHRKALQTVLDFEQAFLKSERDAKAHDLDLDGARREFFGRLDRLRSARRGRGADGDADA
ncbi:MAG: hypothetical protein AAF401_15395 [Pseudomonadota bacterium]